MSLKEKLESIQFHGLEMCKLTSAEKVSIALLDILKDLQAYNEQTGVQSYLTEERDGKSPLEHLVSLLDGLLDKGYKNRYNLFNAHYWAIQADADKEK